MFIRFRSSARRLQLSLVETRRAEGRVRHEHVASLGSIPTPPSVEDRLAFWQRLHQRLARLANRIGPDQQAKFLGDIHARIPMVTLDEQRDLKIADAEANDRFWSRHHDAMEAQAADHKRLAAKAESVAANDTAAAAEAAAKAADARSAVERLKSGEDATVEKPLTREDFERILGDAGMTKADIRQAELFASLPKEALPVVLDAVVAATDRARWATVRRLTREMLAKLESDGDEPTGE